MIVRSFESRDTEKLFSLWNNAHPNTPLSKELMTRKIFLDCNFNAENLLVAEESNEIIAMAYLPHRLFSVRRDGDLESTVGFITYFAVKDGFSVSEVGGKLLDVCEEHHKKGGRKHLSTAYTPLYFTQGFSKKYDQDYITLFNDHGYKGTVSYKRGINLEYYNQSSDFEEKKRKLEKDGIYIGALTYECVSQFLNPELDYSSDTWAWEFRTRLSANLDLERARVAISDKKLIGGCIFGDPNSDEGRFGPLGVSPVCRGKGIGSVLFEDCLVTMKNRGIKYAWAQWTPSSGPAHTLYEKAGFGITDSFITYTKELT